MVFKNSLVFSYLNNKRALKSKNKCLKKYKEKQKKLKVLKKTKFIKIFNKFNIEK